MNNTSVDSYLQDGCGRCDKYQTPDCKVHRWHDVLVALRALVRETELVEEMKWGMPCYTLGGKNVAMIAAFNERCTLSFFKAGALADPAGLLESAGPNSQEARQIIFRSVADVQARRAAALEILGRAIELERSGVKVKRKAAPEPVPAELQRKLDADDALAEAWEALTPGRRRSHVLHVSGAKGEATRERRVEQCLMKIRAGKGYLDRSGGAD